MKVRELPPPETVVFLSRELKVIYTPEGLFFAAKNGLVFGLLPPDANKKDLHFCNAMILKVNPVVQNSNHFLADLKLLTEITA